MRGRQPYGTVRKHFNVQKLKVKTTWLYMGHPNTSLVISPNNITMPEFFDIKWSKGVLLSINNNFVKISVIHTGNYVH